MHRKHDTTVVNNKNKHDKCDSRTKMLLNIFYNNTKISTLHQILLVVVLCDRLRFSPVILIKCKLSIICRKFEVDHYIS